jgi:hypothetical protein
VAVRFASARGQTEPLAALAAVFAVAVGLSLYVGALDATLPVPGAERDVAPTAADRVTAEATTFGAVRPPISDAAAAARPTGYELNATLVVDESIRTAGPSTPSTAACTDRRVSVRVAPGRVRPGRLEVCVWPAA